MACVNHPDREAAARCVVCGDELCAECRHVGPDGKSYCADHLPQPEAQRPEHVEMPPRGEPIQETEAVAAGDSPGLAAACYFCWVLAPIGFLLPVIPLATDRMKRSGYMRYHAYNGLFWGLAVVAAFLVLHVLGVLAGIVGVPALMIAPVGLVQWLVGVAALLASIAFAVRAYNRRSVNIPVVSDIAQQQLP
ncbi:MAG: hypothetical protein U9R79_20975 [Armatimonadota bacterium]|nr:hypothetical protein [Armatimonadota bacterium]